MTPVWSRPTLDLIKSLGTSQSSGLTEAQVLKTRIQCGPNVLNTQKVISNWKLLFLQFKNPMVYTLLLAAIIAGSLGEILDATAILAIVLLNAGIGFAQESKAQTAILALKNLTVPKARVLREGKVKTINSEEVLPGDILQLEAGDYVVADSRVIEAYQLSADEAVLTGESLPVEKVSAVIGPDAPLADRKNMLYAGTAINSGSGRAVVTATGMNTEIGHIAGLLEDTAHQTTPLQERLEKVGNKLLLMGALVILAVSILGFYRGDEIFVIFMSAISLAVAAIPEGLPTVVTLALTLAVRRMTKRNALVRNMASVETLGSTDVICTDKTGTLTTGKMRVREVFTLNHGIEASDEYHGTQELNEALILCNNASLDHGGSGDTTELALLLLEEERGINIAQVREQNLRAHEWSFESDRKRMSVAIDSGNGVKVYCKGAPESLLPLCSLSAEERERVNAAMEELSRHGRRILAVASKEESKSGLAQRQPFEIERDFFFLALIAIADPPKEETIPAIRLCKSAGIRVAMITGDHPVTANAIARELGIPQEGTFDKVLTGAELNALSPEEMRQAVEVTAVYARVTPEHKLKIIEALQANGHRVSMTGDGVNDAPALKRASIGVAMGKAGTEVARQASDMVLTDDNFSTIVAAVEEGRAIFGNIKRTIQYLLSTNLAEILIMLGAAILGLPIPLAPLALLWINLVTDGLPSLALAAEPVEKNFLSSSRAPSPESFFDRGFMRELLVVGLLMTTIVLLCYSYVLRTQDVLSAKSYVFTLLVYLCMLRSFSCRSEVKTYFELPFNGWHLTSVAIPVVLQFTFQFNATFRTLFDVRILSWKECSILFLIGLIPVSVVESVKLWSRK